MAQNEIKYTHLGLNGPHKRKKRIKANAIIRSARELPFQIEQRVTEDKKEKLRV